MFNGGLYRVHQTQAHEEKCLQLPDWPLSPLTLSGCSPSTEDTTDSSAADTAERIVSLSPTATETLYENGAGNQLVAVDSNSNVPADAPRREFSGFKSNPEAVLAENPDLVIASNDTNGLGAALNAVGVRLLPLPAATSFEDAYDLGRDNR